MKEIKLNGKHGKGKVTLVSDEDYDRVNRHKWYVSTRGYVRATIERNTPQVYLHRFILNFYDSVNEIDHINNNLLDNTKSNLRLVTDRQNQYNTRKQKMYSGKDCTSKYKGVSYYKHHKTPNKYKVRISITFVDEAGKIKSKGKHVGHYATELEAAKAYDDAVLKEYGEFAWLNFPSN